MKKNWFDAYIYTPIKENEESKGLIERIRNESRATEGILGKSEFVVNQELLEDSIARAFLFFGRGVFIPYGVRSQPHGSQNGIKKLDFVVGVLHDSDESLKRGYRENISAVMANRLGVSLGSLEYVGIFSGEHGKVLLDFDANTYI